MLVKIEAQILYFSRHGFSFAKHVRASRHVFKGSAHTGSAGTAADHGGV